MNADTREQLFRKLLPDEPAFRWQQIERALFTPGWRGWSDASNLSRGIKAVLKDKMPWLTVTDPRVLSGAAGDTFKAALLLADDRRIETVLMKNRRGEWTVCVSSQVGCAMRCAFCATGRMGFCRDLTADEIVDQYRFWRDFLDGRKELSGRVSNVVFMGMGEPLANYDSVKAALRTLLERTDLGPTRITVSTVGLLPRLEGILTDKDWPPVRLAVSLHSADPLTRKRIMPTTHDEFLPKLADWALRYMRTLGNKRHHLTFEYVMLAGVNDTARHADLLAKFVNSAGRARVNLIPYNFTGTAFLGSSDDEIAAFTALLEKKGVTVTRRRSMGEDIAAACGQLIQLQGKGPAGK